jgi:ABC-type multidrug transport system ATPase subunit
MKISSLCKSYDKSVLQDFSYTFPETGLFLIRGSSGKGKTTLLRLIAGLEKPDSGSVDTQGKRISMVFQEARLVPSLSLLENVLLVSKKPNPKEAEQILDFLGLLEAKDKFPSQLSGGMKLRAAIARSLYYGGDVYLWDEPTKELDPENRNTVINTAKALSETKLVIVVTHDPFFTEGEVIEIK